MSYLSLLGTTLALATSPPVELHTVVVQHPSGPAKVEYRGDPAIAHRQIGSAGRVSTLRVLSV